MYDVSQTGLTGGHQVSVCVTNICDTVKVCCNVLDQGALIINGYGDYVILQIWLMEGRIGGISPDQADGVASRTSLHSFRITHHVAANPSNSPVFTDFVDTVPHGEWILRRLLKQTVWSHGYGKAIYVSKFDESGSKST
jgi:hypothetical protein